MIGLPSPAIAAEPDAARARPLAAAMLRIYDPLSIAALGVAIMTGAFSLTAYKAALRGRSSSSGMGVAGVEALLPSF